MSTTYLAAASSAESLGYVIGLLIIPGIGLALLIAGLITRSKSKKAPQPPQVGYQGQPQYPYPPQPNGGYYGPPNQGPPNYAPPQGGFGPGYAPMPVQHKPKGTGLIISGVIVLVVGLLLSLGTAAMKVASNSGDLAVGDCISSQSYAERDLGAASLDCGDEDAVFELAAKGDADSTCPDGELEESNYAVLLNSTDALCFVPNLKKDTCYNVDVEKNSFDTVECGRPGGLVVRVDDVIERTTDVERCAEPQAALSFPQPKRVVCLAPPN